MDPIANRTVSIFNIKGTPNISNTKPTEPKGDFKAMLTDALNNVNNAQIESQIATEKLARGENIDLHDVMITAQKSSVTLQTTVEVRNKIVEAYQEVMRMQV